MVTRREVSSRKPRARRPKGQPRDPNVGYITHTKDGQVAVGRTVEVFDYQTGTSIKEIDEKRAALRPGRRISRYGNVYYENRMNRSDINPMEGL